MNVQRFDEHLTVNSVKVSGDVVTYCIRADRPVRFMTLKAARSGMEVESVTLDGREYAYFGETFVHLPEIAGDATVTVTLGPGGGAGPHVYHVDPCAVVEDAVLTGEVLSLQLSGEFEAGVRLAGMVAGEAYLVRKADAPADTCYPSADGKMEFVCALGEGETAAEIARASCTAGVEPGGEEGISGPSLYLKCGPNPFSARSLIRFGLPVEADVSVSLYSVDGRQVAVLLDTSLPPGHHSAPWAGLDSRGSRLPSGIYFCRLDAAGRVLTRKVLIVR
jgi:hypothetical protein